ncbi:hypothetical protein EVG20_g11358 [Dentipellis fragilis]|uniref:Tc1-like transposase DDE domain-containing protein n=1 Tax=Dentipellis fragilis TaxID=205917 RepID=A0A4Y9XL14_9AGAM|nr:hypothetical protein EVG20_g11358 [Dentipellis fragilis]
MSFDRRTALRGKAWALCGQRALRKCFFVRGRQYSLLPALSLDGVIWAKIVEGSFTTVRFLEFIEGLLDCMQPFPGSNSVIIMDNARIHKDPEIIETIQARGMRALFLPPYSPDFNPIEFAFSAIKSRVKCDGVLLHEDIDQQEDDSYVYIHLYDKAFSINAHDALGFFHRCRLV